MARENRILIVNDDESIRKQIADLLDSRGKQYVAASSGKEALGLANLYDFSLAFIDLDLPDMPAEDFYAKLLEMEAHYVLPIVSFIDSLDSAEVATLNKVVAMGQITLLSKPAKDEWLSALLDKHLS